MTSAPTTPREKVTIIRGLVGRIIVPSLTLVVTTYLVPLLITYRMWLWSGIVVPTAGAMFLLYSTKRFIPAKYLFPGMFFLTAFLVVPIVLTAQTSLTNFGDGYRGTKERAIASITNNSMVRIEGSPTCGLSVVTGGNVTKGPSSLFFVNPQTEEVLRGSNGKKLEEVDAGTVTVDSGVVTKAGGYTTPSPRQINTAYEDVSIMSTSFTDKITVKVWGIRTAFGGTRRMVYNRSSDTMTSTATGDVYSVKKVGLSEHFVNAEGERLAQSWKRNARLANYSRLLIEGSLTSQFLKALAWTIIFALGSVLLIFGLGFLLALTLNDDRIKGKKLYHSLLPLSYVVSDFISLPVWSNSYNQDFSLIGRMMHLSIPWLFDSTMAEIAVLLTNTWVGSSYIFIVCTGAPQSISGDIKEAAKMGGASGMQATRRIVAPLLLVAVILLLVSTFTFSFNNFNATWLLTEGGPLPAGEYTRGGTGILISMVYRITFGHVGLDSGFASTVSVVLLVVTGILTALQFRTTKKFEDVN